MDNSNLAKRMKEYEQRNRYYLQKRIPVICRLDMRTGHTFTKGFVKPFDEVFIKSMQDTAKYLCENIQGCKLSYQQSDEITLILVDYDKLNIECFFDYRIDKMCSIIASMCTMAFNKAFSIRAEEWLDNEFDNNYDINGDNSKIEEQFKSYCKAIDKGAMFDCRCFNIPKEEVTNLVYWRQLDASRNSIQMLGQANFSHKELQNKNCSQIQDMLIEQKGINWNDLPTYQKRGSCCTKVYDMTGDLVIDSNWVVDKEIPIFKGEGRQYIENLINFEGEE